MIVTLPNVQASAHRAANKQLGHELPISNCVLAYSSSIQHSNSTHFLCGKGTAREFRKQLDSKNVTRMHIICVHPHLPAFFPTCCVISPFSHISRYLPPLHLSIHTYLHISLDTHAKIPLQKYSRKFSLSHPFHCSFISQLLLYPAMSISYLPHRQACLSKSLSRHTYLQSKKHISLTASSSRYVRVALNSSPCLGSFDGVAETLSSVCVCVCVRLSYISLSTYIYTHIHIYLSLSLSLSPLQDTEESKTTTRIRREKARRLKMKAKFWADLLSPSVIG